ncbi:MAG: hypothetical protein A2544_00505 [Candidatus Zambryskibacteria bacterium RIFOXYD2_FULL_43_10]|uniref:Uncharacterized protein n=1 Tax=Candidatus Zambryskibacteria bacterium RIFOXYD2_FULL_43_10 TaxID=1802782 RepID=A0A1G2V905_9BACT|nr:MAG: hypothetical protein A2544_00505 [Candidatus Zambryskibacteria bacterium RIFOXYD2_FULL_43_10]
MNTVFVWGVPIVKETKYVRLTKKIIRYFKRHDLGNVVVFYPSDRMEWDLGKEMAVYVSGPNIAHNVTIRQDIAITIGTFVQEAFNCERISCSVLDEPKGNGYWLSR